jgi:hypothetical protein
VKRGDERVLRVSRDGQTHDVGLRFAPAESFNEDDPSERSLDDAPAMSSVGCRPDEHTLYSDFTLSAVGMNVCVYTPTRGRMDTRLVRFVSFLYDDQAPGDDLRRARADHDLLVRELAGARAVILDLHENHGGNNPYVFLSWFAKRPWDHAQMHVQVSSDLSDHDVRALVWNDPQRFHRYQQAAERGERSLEWPFLCVRNGQTVLDGTCESQGPRESELVTRAPVAVVTGHECTSSCDAFVVNWSAFQMGPLVGRQPAHGFTGMRLSFPLFTPDGRDLGRFSIAYSWEALPRTGAPLEGAPVRLDWEAPRIFQTRHTWVDLSVQEARRRVEAM